MLTSPFDPSVAFAVVTPEVLGASLGASQLLPEESRYLKRRMGKKRVRDFTLGRVAARMALRSLGISEAVPKGPDGEPVWPHGVVGSITHQGEIAIAAVTRQGAVQSLGIDLERVKLNRAYCIEDRVCTRREIRWLGTLKEIEKARMVTALFSAKESVYKAFFQLLRAELRFRDVEICPGDDKKSFVATLLIDLGAPFATGFRFQVFYAFVAFPMQSARGSEFVLTSLLL